MARCPVVIGGIGGSGTRMLAAILKQFDYFIGNDLNTPLDNITFTLLFKRPKWFYRNRLNRKTISVGLNIMEKSMINNKRFTLAELVYLAGATISMARYGHNKEHEGRGTWAFQRLIHIISDRQKEISQYVGWGWKEPNSHLILNNLCDHFPNIKYIHTVRHGLDMAFSTNQQQLFNWGALFGVPFPVSDAQIPYASFRYWVEVNRSVLEQGRQMGPDKFLWLNFDDFCSNPKTGLKKLIAFLGTSPSGQQVSAALLIPSVQPSTGRFRSHDISSFRKDDLVFLTSMGFPDR